VEAGSQGAAVSEIGDREAGNFLRLLSSFVPVDKQVLVTANRTNEVPVSTHEQTADCSCVSWTALLFASRRWLEQSSLALLRPYCDVLLGGRVAESSDVAGGVQQLGGSLGGQTVLGEGCSVGEQAVGVVGSQGNGGVG
jgi:hypothetical protein